MPIEPRDVSVELGVGVRGKPVTERIGTIACIFIGRRVLLEDALHRRTHADSQRVHRFDLARPQRIVADLGNRAYWNHRLHFHWTPGTAGGCSAPPDSRRFPAGPSL